MSFLMRDLKKRISPVEFYVDFLSRNVGTPADIKSAIKVFKKYDLMKAQFDQIYYIRDNLYKLKEILTSRYSIEEYPEYWIWWVI